MYHHHLQTIDELQPESACMIIDTDLEIELSLPKSAQDAEDAKIKEDRSKMLLQPATATAEAAVAVAPNSGSRTIPAATAPRLPSFRSDENSDGSSEPSEDEEEARAKQMAMLPTEPVSSDSEDIVALVVRHRAGRVERRFRHTDDIGLVFDWLQTLPGEVWRAITDGGEFVLVIPYPRRVLTRGDKGKSLQDVNLKLKREQLMIEPPPQL